MEVQLGSLSKMYEDLLLDRSYRSKLIYFHLKENYSLLLVVELIGYVVVVVLLPGVGWLMSVPNVAFLVESKTIN